MNERTELYLGKLDLLVGAKVTGLAVTSQDECGDEFFAASNSPDGTKKILFFLSDDEANAPGSFCIDNA